MRVIAGKTWSEVFLPEKIVLPRSSPSAPREEKKLCTGCQAFALAGVVKSSQLMVSQGEGTRLRPFDIGTRALETPSASVFGLLLALVFAAALRLQLGEGPTLAQTAGGARRSARWTAAARLHSPCASGPHARERRRGIRCAGMA